MYEIEIRREALELKQHVIEIRRDLHRHPEPSQKEFRTQQKIIEELHAIGITEMKTYYTTGIAAIIRGKGFGKTIGIRADMDALYITEDTGLEFSSENAGIAHACGHDGHVSMLLGAARILYSMRDRFKGCVKLIFQPAEEDGLNGGGSQWMIKEGVLTDEPSIDFVIGQHLAPHIPAGYIASKSGPLFTTSDLFSIDIFGKGGHSSAPHFTKDPIVCAAQIILGLQTIVSRNINPADTVVLSICVVEAGKRHNVIPDTARLVGSARSYHEKSSALCRKRIQEIVDGICTAGGLTAKVSFTKSYGPVINDEEMFEKCKKSVSGVIGEKHFIQAQPQSSGEDFSNFTTEIPGVYFLVGAKFGDGEPLVPHSPSFTFDEEALPFGIMNLCVIAVNYLNEPQQ